MVLIDEERKRLHAVDWVVIAVYFLACIIVGLWVSLKLFNSCVRHFTNGHICSHRFAKGSSRSNSNDRSSEYLPAWLMQIFKFCKVSSVKLASICLLQLKYHSIRERKSPGNEPVHGFTIRFKAAFNSFARVGTLVIEDITLLIVVLNVLHKTSI